MQTLSPAVADGRVSTRWIRGPVWDLTMALCWVPFALAALWWNGDGDRIEWLVAATLVLSLSHQPLTMPLVYGDAHVYRSRPRIFALSPFVMAGLVALALQIDPMVIAVVAGVWNAGHTLQQRYGIVRIYGRKSGQADGTIEHRLVWSMLLTALLFAAADPATPDRIAAAGLGARNQRGLTALTDAAPVARVLLPFAVVVVAVLWVQWVGQERRSRKVNPAKWFYLGSTTALIALTVVSPIAGFVGYVGSHALEYYLVVENHLGDRYPDEVTDGGAPLGRAVRSPLGPFGLVALYAVGIAATIWALRSWVTADVYAFVFLTLGGLHLWYDGLIWKLRRPEVARGFRIQSG